LFSIQVTITLILQAIVLTFYPTSHTTTRGIRTIRIFCPLRIWWTPHTRVGTLYKAFASGIDGIPDPCSHVVIKMAYYTEPSAPSSMGSNLIFSLILWYSWLCQLKAILPCTH